MNFTFTPWQGGKEFWHNHTDHSGGDEGKVVGKLRPVLHGTTNPDIARNGVHAKGQAPSHHTKGEKHSQHQQALRLGARE